MSRGSAVLAGVICLGLLLAFSAGRMHGLRTAPEYLAEKQAQRARLDAEIAAAEAEYQGSRQSVCDQVFDLILDQMITEAPPDTDRP